MKLLIATSNQGKLKEITTGLQGLELELVSLQDFPVDDSELEEDGKAYEENAYKKAKFFAEKTGLMTLADDSGIIVKALQGELGVKTRRWGAGSEASDQEWIDYFLKRMEHEDNRKAKFVSTMCLVDAQGNILYNSRGETEGIITKKILAPIKAGIPLSSCFIVEGMDKVHSALTTEEKNNVSHRGKALMKMKEYLNYFKYI